MENQQLQLHRKIKFYRQIYEYNFLPAVYAHPSWLEDLNIHIPGLDDRQLKLYQSKKIITKYELTSCLDYTDQWLVLNSMSLKSLYCILDQVILTVFFSRYNSFMDGGKLSLIKKMYPEKQIKQLFLNNLKINITSDIHAEFQSQHDLMKYRFYLLAVIADNSHEVIRQRYKFRFDKYLFASFTEDYCAWSQLEIEEIYRVVQFYLGCYFPHYLSFMKRSDAGF